MIRNTILAAVLASAPLAAYAAETVYTFDSVTRIEQRPNTIVVTGTLVDETTPTTVTFPALAGVAAATCIPFFATVLARPEAYRLTVVTEYIPPSNMVPGYTRTNGCAVDVKP